MKTYPDPLVDEVRAVRRAISAEHGHDPVRYVRFLLALQAEEEARGKRFIDPPAAPRDEPKLSRSLSGF